MTDQEEADLLAFDVPEACREGVAANLALLATHARVLDRWSEEESDS